jgi:hypothetical protein
VSAVPITFQDEGGVVITGPSIINFTGTGVTATAAGTALNVNVTGGGLGGASAAIQDEGVVVHGAPTVMNFVGTGVSATAVGSNVTITIPGGGGAGAGAVPLLDEGILVEAAPSSINFVGAGVTTTAAGTNVTVTIPGGGVTGAFATPAEAIAGTSTTTIINPADLFARESRPAQTGLSNDQTLIPAPTSNQSPWGVNQLGEKLVYIEGVGWRVVADFLSIYTTYGDPVLTAGAINTMFTYTAPRTGRISITATLGFIPSAAVHLRLLLAKNGIVTAGTTGTPSTSNSGVHTSLTTQYDVVAGNTITCTAIPGNGATFTSSGLSSFITYTK